MVILDPTQHYNHLAQQIPISQGRAIGILLWQPSWQLVAHVITTLQHCTSSLNPSDTNYDGYWCRYCLLLAPIFIGPMRMHLLWPRARILALTSAVGPNFCHSQKPRSFRIGLPNDLLLLIHPHFFSCGPYCWQTLTTNEIKQD